MGIVKKQILSKQMDPNAAMCGGVKGSDALCFKAPKRFSTFKSSQSLGLVGKLRLGKCLNLKYYSIWQATDLCLFHES